MVFHEETLGGATRSVVRLAPLLEARGWRLVFWASRPSPLFDELQELGFEVYGEPRYLAYSIEGLRLDPGPTQRLASVPAYLGSFYRLVRALAPTVVHANSIFTLAEAVVASACRVPVVLHVHEMIGASRKLALGGRLAGVALDEVVAVSHASAAPLARGGRLPRIVHEGAPVPAHATRLRERPRPFVVGTVGVVSLRKGSDLFVNAADKVLREGEDFEFHMIGAPTDMLERSWALQLIDRAVEAGIHYREAADVNQALRRWDAFVLPSRHDPFPIAMLEAMAAGLPTIGARVDGIEEQLEGGAGLLVEPDSTSALAAAIRLLGEASLKDRSAMAAIARRRVATNFTLERQAEGIEAAYLSALGEPSLPSRRKFRELA